MLAVYYCRELSEEEVLIDYLFEEYRPTARPVLRSEDTVLVNLQFGSFVDAELGGHVHHPGHFAWTCSHI